MQVHRDVLRMHYQFNLWNHMMYMTLMFRVIVISLFFFPFCVSTNYRYSIKSIRVWLLISGWWLRTNWSTSKHGIGQPLFMCYTSFTFIVGGCSIHNGRRHSRIGVAFEVNGWCLAPLAKNDCQNDEDSAFAFIETNWRMVRESYYRLRLCPVLWLHWLYLYGFQIVWRLIVSLMKFLWISYEWLCGIFLLLSTCSFHATEFHGFRWLLSLLLSFVWHQITSPFSLTFYYISQLQGGNLSSQSNQTNRFLSMSEQALKLLFPSWPHNNQKDNV